MGAGAWDQTPEGTASYTEDGANGTYKSDETSSNEMYVWAYIKHPIPILPNLRLEYVNIEDSGTVIGKFKDFDTGAVPTTMTYDMKQYDVIPYYNILDNTAWTTLDLGIGAKIIDFSYDVAAAGVFTGYSGSETIAIPFVYARTRIEIPSTNIALEGDIKYVTYGDSKMYDVRAKIDYTLSFIPLIQPAIELGYRVQKLDLDERDATDTNIDLEYAGVYAGLMLRF